MRTGRWRGETGDVNLRHATLVRQLAGRLALLCAMLVGGWPGASSAEPLQWHHSQWRAQEGLRGPVVALAQTPDGWLWIGTPGGLFRFDGVEFERVAEVAGRKLPSNAIRSLAVAPDGALWIGHLYGGVSRLHRGELSTYGEAQGLPRASVMRIAISRDGAVYAAAVHGMFRFQGQQWVAEGRHRQVLDVLIDRQGALWFKAGDMLWRQAADATAAQALGPSSHDDSAILVEAPNGDILDSALATGVRRYRSDGAPVSDGSSPPMQAEALMFSRDGSAWYGRRYRLHRVGGPWVGLAAAPPAQQAPTAHTSLGGQQVFALLEDREGTVWAGTEAGLERLRPNKLRSIVLPQNSVSVAMAVASGGGLWVAAGEHQMLKMDGIGPAQRSFDLHGEVSALRRGSGGVLWAGMANGKLWRIEGERAQAVDAPLPEGRAVQSIVEDAGGGLWLSGEGIYRRGTDGQWTAWAGRDGLPDDSALVMEHDPVGRTWFGFTNDRVAVREAGGKVRVYTAQDGVEVGTVLSIHVRDGEVWIGGEGGVQRLAGGRFHTLANEQGVRFAGVSGIVQRTDGELWLNGLRGVALVPAQEVQRFVVDPRQRVQAEFFDERDGLAGGSTQIRPLPSALQDENGRLWFAGGAGLAWVDPRAISRNPLEPTAQVLRVHHGSDTTRVAGPVKLAPGASHISIDYTALSMQLPERVRFRYRIEGVDDSWQEAGTRRTAYYSNLGPGEYRFQVVAANQDGVWGTVPAEMHLSIAPMLQQTWWFRAMVAALLAALLVLVHRLRVRVIEARAVQALRLRQHEREKVATDLHDTLLQAIYGLLLRLHTLKDQVPEGLARERLEATLESAERLVDEGRNRVAGLRGYGGQDPELRVALQSLADEVQREHGVTVQVLEEGPVRMVRAQAQEELMLIAREATWNAVRHASPTSITIKLLHGVQQLQLSVHDDGTGIPAQILESSGGAGHWGLQGMSERAASLCGTLSVAGKSNMGTTVTIKLPAPNAYSL